MENKHSRNIMISGAIYSVIIILWPVFMALSASAAGTLEEKIMMIGERGTLYYLNFVFASLIAPSIVVFIAVISGLYRRDKLSFYDTMGMVLLVAYSVLISISYISQYAILPKLISRRRFEEAMLWFFENTDSLAYFFNQMGYCLFGIGVLLVFRELLAAKGLIRAVGVIFYTSGILSVVAFVGLLMQNKMLNSTTIFSGLLLVPVGILGIIAEVKNRKTQCTG
ncbi:MAG: hypothetical protein N2484_13660 [Clostridia bacterium]|nr:hypothetical protein [Clostridia bacterium]